MHSAGQALFLWRLPRGGGLVWEVILWLFALLKRGANWPGTFAAVPPSPKVRPQRDFAMFHTKIHTEMTPKQSTLKNQGV